MKITISIDNHTATIDPRKDESKPLAYDNCLLADWRWAGYPKSEFYCRKSKKGVGKDTKKLCKECPAVIPTNCEVEP